MSMVLKEAVRCLEEKYFLHDLRSTFPTGYHSATVMHFQDVICQLVGRRFLRRHVAALFVGYKLIIFDILS